MESQPVKPSTECKLTIYIFQRDGRKLNDLCDNCFECGVECRVRWHPSGMAEPVYSLRAKQLNAFEAVSSILPADDLVGPLRSLRFGVSDAFSCTVEPLLSNQPILGKLLALVGVTEAVGSDEEFRRQGADASMLRNPAHSALKFFSREKTIQEIFSAVANIEIVVDKMPLITIPAGPGQGKTEIVARIVEQYDEFITEYNKLDCVKIECDTWIACAVSFNYVSCLESLEQALLTDFSVSASFLYELTISFRLIYTWFVKKVDGCLYRHFLSTLFYFIKNSGPHDWLMSFSLRNVISLIRGLSKRQKIMLFIDESIRPLQLLKLSESEQMAVISSIAQLQSNDFVIIFTNLRQNPFQLDFATESGRQIVRVLMSRLSSKDSYELIIAMLHLKQRSCKTSLCLNKCQTSVKYHHSLVSSLAIWTGGTPRLCEIAAFAISASPSDNINEVIGLLYASFKTKYQTSQTSLPREAVILALAGAKIMPGVQCLISSSEDTVDDLIARGLLVREFENRIFQSPLVLRLFCDIWSPPLSPEDIAARVSSPFVEYSTSERFSVTPASELLINEIRLFLGCLYPSSDGKQFEAFDRLQTRLGRLVRSQIISDISDSSIYFTSLESGRNVCSIKDGIVTGGFTFYKQNVNWHKASLTDYFGCPRYSTVEKTWLDARFDVSCPFLENDFEFEAIPPPRDNTFLLGKQFYPFDKQQAGFDWFTVLLANETGKLLIVASENKFSLNLCASNKVKLDDDIQKKYSDTLGYFQKAGWPSDQIIFRLSAHRYLSEFSKSTLGGLPPNVMIYGPEELINSYTPSIHAIFSAMIHAENTK